MGLLDTSTIVLAAVLAASLGLGAVLVAYRLPVRRFRLAGVAGLVIAAQAAAVLFAGLVVNANFGLYASWGELFGHTALRSVPQQPAGGAFELRYHDQLLADYQHGQGTVLPFAIPAPSIGLPDQPGLIYLPPQYGNPQAQSVRYPVIELMDGVPGHPDTWIGPLHLQRTLDTMINSLASEPFIAVMPLMTVIPGRDTECVNVLHGPAVDTYLTRDVRSAVLDTVRAQSDRHGWGIMGYSTGGYCALNLAMHHPDLFAATISLSGYDRPYLDRSTGALFGRDTAVRLANTPLWEAQHWSSGSLNLLVVASKSDKDTYQQALELRDAARGKLHLTVVLVAHGGHNFGLWSLLEPLAFNWLSHQLNPALATLGTRGTATVPPRSSHDGTYVAHARPPRPSPHTTPSTPSGSTHPSTAPGSPASNTSGRPSNPPTRSTTPHGTTAPPTPRTRSSTTVTPPPSAA